MYTPRNAREARVAVTLRKWGNSIGVRLPKPMLEQVGPKEGAQVDVLVEGDHLVIRRGNPKLADLLDQCKPENRPDPIDFGPPVGREMI
jgi:antitoxin MazE